MFRVKAVIHCPLGGISQTFPHYREEKKKALFFPFKQALNNKESIIRNL